VAVVDTGRTSTSTSTSTRDAYLARLGLEAEPPSPEALFRLHRSHVERVAYETLWIHLGERWGIDAAESLERIAHRRRGGYCYHLNGAFSELLALLGYHVDRHVGGVHGPAGPDADLLTNHLVLTVRDLSTDDNPGGVWYVDVGLGDALYEPLPLLAGDYRQGPFRFVLEESAGGVGDWHLVHDSRGAFSGMSWEAAPVGLERLEDRHRHLSTSPESGFVKVLTLLRRDATGADVLRGLELHRVEEETRASTIASRNELVAVLGDLFGLDVDAVGDRALDALWDRTHRKHLAWEAAGRP
jgi:N-hydroxyarylamine O-acetyltransferase